MMDQTRMPIVPASQRNKSAPFVGETEFIDPDNESEHVKIYIHMAQVEFLDDKLEVSKKTNASQIGTWNWGQVCLL